MNSLQGRIQEFFGGGDLNSAFFQITFRIMTCFWIKFQAYFIFFTRFLLVFQKIPHPPGYAPANLLYLLRK